MLFRSNMRMTKQELELECKRLRAEIKRLRSELLREKTRNDWSKYAQHTTDKKTSKAGQNPLLARKLQSGTRTGTR